MICHGCGGVVGRDCFNPMECEQITRSMADESQVLGYEVQYLQRDLEQARQRIYELEQQLQPVSDVGEKKENHLEQLSLWHDVERIAYQGGAFLLPSDVLDVLMKTYTLTRKQ